MTDTTVCFDLYTAYPVRDLIAGIEGGVGIGGVILGLVYFLSAGVTVFWIRKQQHNARQGMEGAAMHVIFPIYLPFLWCSSLSDLLVGLVILFCNIHFRQSNPWDSAVIVAVAFALQHFVIEGTAFVLMQYGCGWQAVKNAAWWAGGWAIASFFVQFMLYYDGDTQVSFFANLFWNLLQLAFYGTLWFAPETKLFRRGAVIYYSRFWTILRLSVIVQDVLYRYGTTDTEIAAANCIYAVMVLPVFIMFKPIVVYKSLLYDSVWWQGLQAGSVLDSIAMSVTPTSSTRAPGGVSRRASSMKNDAWWGARLYAAVFGETVVALTEQSLISRSQSASSKHSSGLSGLLGSSQHSVSSSHFSYRIVSDQDAADGAGGASGLGGGGGDEESNERSSSNSYLQDDSAQSAALLVEQQQLRSPLMGMEVGFSEAQALAKEVDAIRREGTVRLLNFAYLTVDRQNATTVDKNPLHSGGSGGSGHADSGGTSSGLTAAAAAVAAGAGAGAGAGGPTLPSVGAVSGLLGTGSFSRVYAGWYKRHRVAIKMLFTQDLNPDVIRRYSNEARILSELSDHPNVVKIFGVAVLPPSVCIVLEICEFGSLSDVLRGSTSAIAPRAPLLLTMADRMFLALGCARGLAALHAYAPDLCHRDIKSMNFLIDRHLNAKIADLDLGVEYARRYEEKKRSAFGGFGGGGGRGSGQDTDSDSSFGHRMSSTDSLSGHHAQALAAAGGSGGRGGGRGGGGGGGGRAAGGQPQHHYRSLTSFLLGRSAQKPRQNHPLYPPTRHAHRQLSSGGGGGGGGAMSSSHGGFQYSKKFGRSHGMNITWQAPEVLLGLSYSQKSDVYSLGLVLWEIIAAGRSVKKYSMTTTGSGSGGGSGGGGGGGGGSTGASITATNVAFASIPFSECHSQNEICERVVQGFRPSIAPFLPSQPPAHASQSHRHTHTHTRNGAMLVDPHYLDVLQRCWDMDVHARPTARAVEDALHATWFQSVHRVLRTTAHVVDRSVVAQEHAKISREFAEHQQLLQQRATAAAAANPHASAAKRLKLPRTRLSPPSPALMTALDVLRHELRWHDLDTDYDSPSQLWNQSEGCYLVVTPTYPPTTTAPSSFFAQSIASGLTEFRRFFSPSSASSFAAASGDTATMAAMGPAPFHCVVWATRKWLHRMGFLMHDVLGLDLLQACRSHHTDEAALRLMLQEASDPATARTKSHHLVTRLCRRDGREVTLSLHAFPVFQRPTATDAAAVPHTAAPAAAPAASAAAAPAPTTTTTTTKAATMPRGGSGAVLASQAPLLSMDLSLNSIEEDDTLSSCSARSSISSRGTAVAPSTTAAAATAAAAMAMAMAATSAPASRPSSKPGSLSEASPLPRSVVYEQQPPTAADDDDSGEELDLPFDEDDADDDVDSDEDANGDEDDDDEDDDGVAADGGLEHADRQRAMTAEALLVSASKVRRRKRRQRRLDRQQQQQRQQQRTWSAASARSTVWRDVPSVPATPAIGATPAGSNAAAAAAAQQRSTSIGGLSATWVSQLTTSAAMSPPMGSLLGGGASQAEVEVVDTSSSRVSPPPVAASASDEDGGEDARLLPPVDDEDGAAARASSTASSLPSLPSPITSPAASRRPAPTVASAAVPRGPVGSTGGGGGSGKTPGAAATGSLSHKAATTSFSTNATPQVAYLVLQFSMILGDPNKALHPST